MTREEAQALADRENAKGRSGVSYEVGETEPKQLALGAEPAVTPFYVWLRRTGASAA